MTNKPMLSVERDSIALEALKAARQFIANGIELGFISMPEPETPDPAHDTLPMIDRAIAELKAAQQQGEPVAQSEFEHDAICEEADGCPTEGAVLKRFWRENQTDPVLCEFYEAESLQSLVRELVAHVAQLQEAAKRNVKPWEDTFPPTLLPAYIARLNAEQLAPVADHTQCEECKGWGYHENHHEGGGTKCGECGGSGKATVEKFSGDTVVCRRYQLEQSPGQNFYHYDLEPVYGSVPVTVSELITLAESAPPAVVMPEDWEDQLFAEMSRRFYLRKQIDDDHMVYDDTQIGVEFASDWIKARLNGVKP